ncbi:RIP metalloprotease RseP [Chengkuizengella axinellae]|uniref:Zinc metalloprotease n=1 Tax=Chengkuizengella axinellae TaxID=3064388 RepID=A0ABT9IVU1_9BACL|nr:RIP metalloprotease RseP [Chengkuizengella sp. 2205SS18-9]MDP5273476.1 RIP metalloprotease RseP [Chengkuizengella sp. 2205SS18-9]
MTIEVIIIALLMFFLLVGIHEWGHFYFAKRVGILVREFAIGFGPKLLSIKKNETRYTFRLLPMGGYVRMAGEDPEIVQINPGQTIAVKVKDNKVTNIYLDKLDQRTDVIVGTVESIDLEHKLSIKIDVDGELQTLAVHPEAHMETKGRETQIAPWNRQFGSKTVAQRALVIVAGPVMNFILAFFLFLTFVYMVGITVDNPTHVLVGNVTKDSPAELGGLKADDIILEVNGETIGTDKNKLITLIAESPDHPMNWLVVREDIETELQITPRANENGNGLIGISIQDEKRSPDSIFEGVSYASKTMWNVTERIFISLKMLVTLQFSLDDLGGPIRITEMTGEAASYGIDTLIGFVATISLYLGIFNLLPFPALDGSRLMFFGIEAVRGKPVDPNRESMVHFIGFAVLMVLMIAVTYNDILRLFKG